MTVKAVILARGLGTRMRAVDENSKLDFEQIKIAELGVKALIPIIGKRTFLDVLIDNLRSAGFAEICLVIGDEHEILKDFCRKNALSFVIQAEPLGTANAILSAEKFADGEHFSVVNSDNIYPLDDLRKLQSLTEAGLIAFKRESLIAKSNISAEKIQKFAVVDFDETDYLTQIVEKPENIVENSFVSMNALLFSTKIFEACKNIDISSRGEFELADAVNFAVKNLGEKFKAVYSNEGVLDLSSRADIESVRQKLTETGLKYE
jgi:glucose-1-phosphate thymidylyltransferase